MGNVVLQANMAPGAYGGVVCLRWGVKPAGVTLVLMMVENNSNIKDSETVKKIVSGKSLSLIMKFSYKS